MNIPAGPRASPPHLHGGPRGYCARGALAVLSLLIGACASSSGPLPLARVDLNRMYGDWYLIATIPNWFERGLVAPRDTFSRRPDGDIREDFSSRRNRFDAPEEHFVVHDWVRPGTGNAHWRVQVFWPIDLPFLVLYVDPNYRYALFGEEDRSLGWIYARDQTIDESTYADLLAHFRAVGYDVSPFRRFVQKPEQIDQLGFWSDGIVPADSSTGRQ